MARLGYSQYFAQGGDWGSVITSYIARQDPEHCLGIHINMGIVALDPNAENLTANELSIMAGWKYYQDRDAIPNSRPPDPRLSDMAWLTRQWSGLGLSKFISG